MRLRLPYCPFAKRRDSREQLRADRAALERFTHWGEGLVRSWCRRALTELSHRPHIRRIAAKCHEPARLGVRFSVGIVGLPEHLEPARRLRAELGNLYDGTHRQALGLRTCPLTSCDCHIGYVHLETLPLYDVFAGGVLERIPASPARTGPRDRAGLPRDSAASRFP